jgi:hypothetical protein
MREMQRVLHINGQNEVDGGGNYMALHIMPFPKIFSLELSLNLFLYKKRIPNHKGWGKERKKGKTILVYPSNSFLLCIPDQFKKSRDYSPY